MARSIGSMAAGRVSRPPVSRATGSGRFLPFPLRGFAAARAMTEPESAADLSRRRLLQAAGLSLAAMTLGTLAGTRRALAAAMQPTNQHSKLILLGTAGGPTPKADRSAPANAIVIGNDIYVIDCGNGVARQMMKAGLDLGRTRDVFITHQHSDHNADYGNLLL